MSTVIYFQLLYSTYLHKRGGGCKGESEVEKECIKIEIYCFSHDLHTNYTLFTF